MSVSSSVGAPAGGGSERLRIRQELLRAGLIAVIRTRDARRLPAIGRALSAGGVRVLEVTLTIPGALDVIRALREDDGVASTCLVGAGTVLDDTSAEAAIAAGAQFVVSPVLCDPVMDACRRRDVFVVPGAFSPTEIWTAAHRGADAVKLFPASALRPAFVRDLLAPLPHLCLIPTGGVTLDNAADWLRAGAAAVGVGSALVDPELVAGDRMTELTHRAQRFAARVAEARRCG